MIKWMLGGFIALLGVHLTFATSQPLFNLVANGNVLTITTTKPGWFYQFAGIKSLNQGYSFSNCTVSDNGFCLFSVSNTAPVNLTIQGPLADANLKLCLNALGQTYSCESANTGARFAYVTNMTANTVQKCPLNANGGFGVCVDSGLGNIFNWPRGILLNSPKTIVYVTNAPPAPALGSIVLCQMDGVGNFSSCLDSGVGNIFSTPRGIIFNNAGNMLYVSNIASNSVMLCAVSANGSLGNCIDSGLGAIFNAPRGIALNKAENIAYVVNNVGNSIYLCTINANGTFSSCIDSGQGATFNEPSGIILNQAGTIAYVSNQGSDQILMCPINTNGSFGLCVDSGQGAIFNGPTGILFNEAASFIYVVNFDNSTVFVCPMNSNGTLGACNASGNGFVGPVGITM